ncbi:hypothetical protein HHI36_012693 [Cryptolaemus montrouzieri]|uniref:HTH psq-type domain-containing protein n=1 Tax=Cryptolaemus montrouzieri TaxID=559131 RepID=A0ABD2NF72_9CUCU
MGPRKQWSQIQLENALEAINEGQSQRAASKEFKVPRRTLKRYLNNGLSEKRLGRPSILSVQQERDFVQRIKRYCEVGLPLTPKLVRRQMFKYCQKHSQPI